MLRSLDRANRRVHHHPLFHGAVVHNKMWFAAVLLGVPCLVLVLLIYERTHTAYYLFTGPAGGTSALLGDQFAAVLNRPVRLERLLHLNLIPDFHPVTSCGSLTNIASINQGSAHLAFVEDGLPMQIGTPPTCLLPLQGKNRPQEPDDESRVRAVMPLYLLPLHVLSPKRLNFDDIRDIRPHSKVYIGPEGSASAFISQLVLKHEGIAIDRQGKDWDFERGMQELLKGRIDAAFFLMALNSDAIKRLLDSPDFHLLTVESADGLRLLAPYLEVVKIPPATYKVSSREITTVAAKAILVASTDLKDAEVYQVAEKLSHHIHDLLKTIPLNVSKVGDGGYPDLFYPLHDGAVRFYTHNPPFFLDPHFLAGIGTYLSLVYAGYKMSIALLRRYRVHRILSTLESIIARSKRPFPADPHLHTVRVSMARLLREGRLSMEDLGIINEFIKHHSS